MKGFVLLLALVAFPAAQARADSFSLRDHGVLSLEGSHGGTFEYQDGDVATDEPITPARAILYSLLLPGLGDWKLGNHGRATVFFAAEGAIWVSYATFQLQGRSREDEFESLAMRFAGVEQSGHSDEFYALLREYDNAEQYEADVKTDGRFELSDDFRHPERVGAEALDRYFTENRVGDYEPWEWASFERRLQYSEVRSSSKTSFRRADYMLAAAAANRVASAIFAYAGARHARKEREVGYRIDFAPSLMGGVDVSVMLTRRF